MYRLIVESLLGVTRDGNRLRLAPCLPADWPGLALRYRYGSTPYEIELRQTFAEAGEAAGASAVTVDGTARADGAIPLVDDGTMHRVLVEVRATRA